MKSFKTRGVGLVAALAVSAFVPVAADAGAPSSPMPQAVASCTSAKIVGQRKCVQAGQYCKNTSRANRDYHRYGLHCGKRDRRGSYHLVYR